MKTRLSDAGRMAKFRRKAVESPFEDRETESMLDREVGPSAMQRGDTYFQLSALRLRHAEGDKLAALESVVLCHERRAHVPRWAVSILGDALKRYLDDDTYGIDLDRAFFASAGRLKGPVPDPRRQVPQRQRNAFMHAILAAAEFLGFVGDEKLRVTREVLGRFGMARGEDTLRQYKSRLPPGTLDVTSELFMWAAAEIGKVRDAKPGRKPRRR